MADWDYILELGFEYTGTQGISRMLCSVLILWWEIPVEVLRSTDSDDSVGISQAGEDADSVHG